MRTRIIPAVALCLAVSLASACGKRDSAPGAQQETTSSVSVSSVDVGRSVNADKSIAEATTTFRPAETMYVSVQTQGSGNATLNARWTFQDGQVVDESSQTIT